MTKAVKALSILLILAALFGLISGILSLKDISADSKSWDASEDEIEKTLKDLEDGLNRLKGSEQSYLNMRELLEQTRKEISDGKTALAAARARYETEKQMLEKRQSELDARRKKQDASAKQIEENTKQLEKDQKDLEEAKQKLDEAAKQLDTLRDLVNGEQREYDTAKKDLDDAAGKLAENKTKLENLRTEYSSTNSRQEELAKEIEAGEEQLGKDAAALEAQKEEYENAKNAISSYSEQDIAAMGVYHARVDALIDKGMSKDQAVNATAAELVDQSIAERESSIRESVTASVRADVEQKVTSEKRDALARMFDADSYSDLTDEQKAAVDEQMKSDEVKQDISQTVDIQMSSESVAQQIDQAVAQQKEAIRQSELPGATQTVSAAYDGYETYQQYLPVIQAYEEAYAAYQQSENALNKKKNEFQQNKETIFSLQSQISDLETTIEEDQKKYDSNKTKLAEDEKQLNTDKAKLDKDQKQYDTDRDKHDKSAEKLIADTQALEDQRKQLEEDQNLYARDTAALKEDLEKNSEVAKQLDADEKKIADKEKQLADTEKQIAVFEEDRDNVIGILNTAMNSKPVAGVPGISDRLSPGFSFMKNSTDLDIDKGFQVLSAARDYSEESRGLIGKERPMRTAAMILTFLTSVCAVFSGVPGLTGKPYKAAVPSVITAVLGAATVILALAAGISYSGKAGTTAGLLVAASGAVLCAAGIACAVLALILRKSENE